MSEIVKFTFDRRFDVDHEELARKATEEAARKVEPPPPPTFTEADLAEARTAGFAEGHAAGIAEAEKRSERQAAMALGVIGERLAEVEKALAGARAVAVEETAALARAMARKVAGRALEQAALAEIEAVAAECLERLYGEARIVVHVGAGMAAVLEPRLHRIAARAGFGGSLVVEEDPEVGVGDCRLVWSNGGAERRTEDLWQAIDAVIDRFLQSDEPSAGPDGPAGEAAATTRNQEQE